MVDSLRTSKVVALGGGHGLAASLSALRLVCERVTAIVTVADNVVRGRAVPDHCVPVPVPRPRAATRRRSPIAAPRSLPSAKSKTRSPRSS